MSTAAITPAMAKRIEFWPVDRLVPYARNARTHSDEQIEVQWKDAPGFPAYTGKTWSHLE